MRTNPIDNRKRNEDLLLYVKKNAALGFVLLTLVFFFFKIVFF